MKKIVLLLILTCAFTVQSQYRNGQRQRQRSTPRVQQKTPEPKFEIKKHLRIVIYDVKKAAKKSSIKLTSIEGKQFFKVILKYNQSIKDITRINSFLLRNTKEMVENFQKESMKSRNFSKQPEVYKKMTENLKPISETLKEEDIKLDATIKSLLSEKQYKKWIKYNKKIHKTFPKE
jgi:hypothetical protein